MHIPDLCDEDCNLHASKQPQEGANTANPKYTSQPSASKLQQSTSHRYQTSFQPIHRYQKARIPHITSLSTPHPNRQHDQKSLPDPHHNLPYVPNQSMLRPQTNATTVPPVGVFLVAGCGMDLLINIVLTLLGYLPGHLHAFYIGKSTSPPPLRLPILFPRVFRS